MPSRGMRHREGLSLCVFGHTDCLGGARQAPPTPTSKALSLAGSVPPARQAMTHLSLVLRPRGASGHHPVVWRRQLCLGGIKLISGSPLS